MGARKRTGPALLPGLPADGGARLLSGPGAAGIDEVGRGCLAGPVVACAVCLPEDADLPGLDDSKRLTPAKREALAPLIRERALAWGLGAVPAARIDETDILRATFEAMSLALRAMLRRRLRARGVADGRGDLSGLLPAVLLVDGNRPVPGDVLARTLFPGADQGPSLARLLPAQRCIVGGDGLVPAISAASVLAKTWRDALMVRLARAHPGYGLEIHKGYGTKAHLEALRRLGPSPLHRLTFAGVLPEGERRDRNVLPLGRDGRDRGGRHD